MLVFWFLFLLVAPALALHPEGFISLINATPYDWNLTSQSNERMLENFTFPSIITAGSSHVEHYMFNHHRRYHAEATFTLVDAPHPMSFTVFARNSRRIEIQYHDNLSSLNNPAGSLINLGWTRHGAVSFTLAGSATDGHPFISSNPPITWMQSTLDTIGSKSLREISIPASHDAGMNEGTGYIMGVGPNTLTQTYNIFDQLKFGARYLDIRPVRYMGSFWTGHFTISKLGPVGGYGRSLNKVVADINNFNKQHPGELVILNISHDMNKNEAWNNFNDDDWQALYQILNQIEDLWITTKIDLPHDLSTIPISSFITPGSKSAVIVRLPVHVAAPKANLKKRAPEAGVDMGESAEAVSSQAAPNEANAALSSDPIDWIVPPFSPVKALSAFIPSSRLPETGSYSNAHAPEPLITDQLNKLSQYRPSTQSASHSSVWTITQNVAQVLNVAVAKDSIRGLAIQAQRALYAKLWPALSSQTYPNYIEIDNVRSSELTALCMSINRHFAAQDGLQEKAKRGVFYNSLCLVFREGCNLQEATYTHAREWNPVMPTAIG